MPRLPNLPVGKSSFERIRKDGDVYVDKTRYIFEMVDQGQPYFLSRPRRFGKSLTVSTLKCLFEGKRELFDGLWIAENTEWEWKEHPVVLLDFNQLVHDSPENLKISLGEHLSEHAETLGIKLKKSLLKDQFKELILALHKKTGMPVAVLIDEYDKPLIDFLGKGEEALNTAKANRDILKHFLGVLKGGDVEPVLRLIFITGVSKFSRVSIFSELNNLTDLTMHRRYAEMLGYTQEELETDFAGHIEAFANQRGENREAVIERLRVQYNGYRFSPKDVRVYNPFSVLKALDEMEFKNYWFETGTPTFLVNLLRENRWHPPKIEDMKATDTMFSTYDLDHLKLEALLFQTGYVTIKDIRGRLYTFDYPNREVKSAFLETLFHSYAEGMPDRSRFVYLAEHLLAKDLDAFIETMKAIFAAIPYTLETKRDEAYFHTVFYLAVSASGADARSEVLTCDGRIDLVVEFEDKVFILEFKCNQTADAALAQIREKGYAAPYRGTGKGVFLVGINFDTKLKNISEWKWERI
ncbi:MAG: AAA family ATPase [Desulfococcaceae bacterium]